MIRRNPSSAFNVASTVAAPRRPCVKVSLPRRTPREASSRIRIGPPGVSSATSSLIELAPMSRTATARGLSGGRGTELSVIVWSLAGEALDVGGEGGDGRGGERELERDVDRLGDEIEASPGA